MSDNQIPESLPSDKKDKSSSARSASEEAKVEEPSEKETECTPEQETEEKPAGPSTSECEQQPRQEPTKNEEGTSVAAAEEATAETSKEAASVSARKCEETKQSDDDSAKTTDPKVDSAQETPVKVEESSEKDGERTLAQEAKDNPPGTSNCTSTSDKETPECQQEPTNDVHEGGSSLGSPQNATAESSPEKRPKVEETKGSPTTHSTDNLKQSQDNKETPDTSVQDTPDLAQGDNSKYELSEKLVDRIKGVIYGNCIGDAIGLLTEFMSKKQACKVYHHAKRFFGKTYTLEYNMKSDDSHRIRWAQGDWTDDSDQMLLILITLVEKDGQFDEKLFASKMLNWCKHGYPELGDNGGMGLGMTTGRVLRHNDFLTNPHKAAREVWVNSGRKLAPNGGVMRTSVLGTMEFHDLEKVIANTKRACMVTHADPRCIASCIAVTVAIALMLQGQHKDNHGEYKVDEISRIAHEHAEKVVEDEDQKKELEKYMFQEKLENLELDEPSSIGYTLKCLGAGFWAFRQKDFREAIQQITMEAGDADTNCTAAGALLGCKIGFSNLPKSWVKGLKHREWLENHISRYLELLTKKCSKE